MMDDESAIVNIEFGFHFGIVGMCSDRKARRQLCEARYEECWVSANKQGFSPGNCLLDSFVRMKKIFDDARPCRGEEAYKPTEHQQQNNSGSPQAPEISVF